jgi:hypothetical protein
MQDVEVGFVRKIFNARSRIHTTKLTAEIAEVAGKNLSILLCVLMCVLR